MQLYAGTSTQFIADTTHNAIAGKLETAFLDAYRYKPSPSEVQSWRNSLQQMSNVLRAGDLLDHGVLLEYQLPLSSKRLDCMVTGHDDQRHPGAVVVELKQWGDAGPSDAEDCVTTFVGGRERDLLHPSRQVGQYEEYLRGMHSEFGAGGVELRSCAFLHNLDFDPANEIFLPKFDALRRRFPTFAGDQQGALVQYMRAKLSAGDGVPVLDRVVGARLQASRKLLAQAARVIGQQSAFVLIDEQLVVFNRVLSDVRRSVSGRGRKSIHLIRGGPGTGKSIVALHLLGRLAADRRQVLHLTGSKAFTEHLKKLVGPTVAPLFKYFNFNWKGDVPANQFDAIVLDEAHRLRKQSTDRFHPKKLWSGKAQIDEIVDAAKVSVFFIDDLQVVKPGEVGSSELIRAAATGIGADLHEVELEAQFRCAGSAGFVNWIDNTLGIRPTANILWQGDPKFEFRIFDDVESLDRAIQQAAKLPGCTARLAAGYCWPWSDPAPDGSLVDDVRVGDWSRPWNARPDAGKLAAGIPKAQFWASEPGGEYQVGCVYTAQGFEFDIAGVIVGPDLRYDWERNEWVGDWSRSMDPVVKKSKNAFLALARSTYRVLLTRGMRGCYVYFMDEGTRRFFQSRIESNSAKPSARALARPPRS
jgi:hypothetical protein